ncbi:MAG: hypothetical protein ACK4S4_07165 [Pyrinomonadaceae bacterium]
MLRDSRITSLFLCVAAAVLLAAAAAHAQTTKRNSRPQNPAAPATKPSPTPAAATDPSAPSGTNAPEKKNGRPADTRSRSNAAPSPSGTRYTYEFSRPEFPVPHVLIVHDETGKGTITFARKGSDDEQTDPVALADATLKKINDALAALDFLDSTANYQYEKDYSHLGSITFTYRKADRERTVKFNWTTNVNARTIADEYRKISNQYVWQFDMAVALENQPLEAPKLMDTLDSFLRRGEISDPPQMLPLLKRLANDERIPLIARNHAAKLAAKIEKDKK